MSFSHRVTTSSGTGDGPRVWLSTCPPPGSVPRDTKVRFTIPSDAVPGSPVLLFRSLLRSVRVGETFQPILRPPVSPDHRPVYQCSCRRLGVGRVWVSRVCDHLRGKSWSDTLTPSPRPLDSPEVGCPRIRLVCRSEVREDITKSNKNRTPESKDVYSS